MFVHRKCFAKFANAFMNVKVLIKIRRFEL